MVWLRWVLSIAALLTLLIVAVSFLRQWEQQAFERKCGQIISWVKANHSTPGNFLDLNLPPALNSLSADGQVHAVVLPDGRVVILLKTSIGWKQNFTGIVYTSAPLQPTEIRNYYYDGEPEIWINASPNTCPGNGLPEHCIKKKFNDHCYEVEFNLG